MTRFANALTFFNRGKFPITLTRAPLAPAVPQLAFLHYFSSSSSTRLDIQAPATTTELFRIAHITDQARRNAKLQTEIHEMYTLFSENNALKKKLAALHKQLSTDKVIPNRKELQGEALKTQNNITSIEAKILAHQAEHFPVGAQYTNSDIAEKIRSIHAQLNGAGICSFKGFA